MVVLKCFFLRLTIIRFVFRNMVEESLIEGGLDPLDSQTALFDGSFLYFLQSSIVLRKRELMPGMCILWVTAFTELEHPDLQSPCS